VVGSFCGAFLAITYNIVVELLYLLQIETKLTKKIPRY
jgi:hypothetical protein